MSKLVAIPIDLREANDLVASFHRHSKPVRGHKFAVACSDGEEMAGCAILGRPVARELQDGFTAEILRTVVLPPFQAGAAEVGARKDEGWTNRPGRDWQPVYGQDKLRWERNA